MNYITLFYKMKRLLVTSALVLVAFFAGDCPETPQPQLAVSKVTINGTGIDLKDANAVQENVPLEPTVVVTFDKAVTLNDVRAKVKLTTQEDNQNVVVEFEKTSDGVFTISLPAGTSLNVNTDYFITIEKDLKAAVDGIIYTLSQTLSLKFKTLAQNNNASLKVEYGATVISPSETNFMITVPNSTNLQNILLKFTVGVGAKLAHGETLLTLNQDRSVTQAFDFSDGNTKTFTVTSEDGTKKTYQVTVNVQRSSDTSLKVEYKGTYVVPNGTTFSITAPQNENLNTILLKLTVGEGARLFHGTNQTSLTLDANRSVTRNYDFQTPNSFKVVAEDGTEQTYQITVILQNFDSKDITGFSFKSKDNSSLQADVNGIISGNIITVVLPANVSRQGLVPLIQISGASVSPGSEVSQDFTSEITYTVTASDATTKVYTVRVINNFIVAFNTGAGSSNVTETEVQPGKNAIKPHDPTRTGNIFGGWYKESDFKTKFVFENEPITKNIILYAKWLSEITFNTGQGGSDVAKQEVQSGEKAIRPVADPTRSGYAFGGWYKESNFQTEFVFENEPITKNIILYAKWLSKDASLITLSIGGSAVRFVNNALTMILPYGSGLNISYSNLDIANGATAKDVNADGSQVLGSTGSLLIANNTLKIVVTAEDAVTKQIYTVTITNIADKPTVVFYTGTDKLGQAIKDEGLMDFVVATVSNLADRSFTITLGDLQVTKTVTRGSGRFDVMKNDVRATMAGDDAVLTIKYGNVSPLTLAHYKPSNIYTWRDLQAMRVNLMGNYVLMKDIEFPEPGNGGFSTAGFEPVGKDMDRSKEAYQGTDVFKGTLDGNNKRIKNFAVNDRGLSFVGLFGKVEHADMNAEVLKNVVFEDANILCRAIAGVGAGWLVSGKFVNVGIELSEESTGDTVMTIGVDELLTNTIPHSNTGGLVGYINSTGSLSTCYNQIPVKGTKSFIGGLVGSNGGTVTGYTSCSVYGEEHIGGLAGANGKMLTGYMTGSVYGKGSTVGGLVGSNSGNGITKGYMAGSVRGDNQVGGLVGWAASDGTIAGYVTGSVKGNNQVGGLVGYSFLTEGITGYASGRIEGKGANVGGLVGEIYDGPITGYWDTASTGQATSPSGSLITSIGNVYQFIGNDGDGVGRTSGKFYDSGTGTKLTEGDLNDNEVFKNSTFLESFDLPKTGKWPKLKDFPFSQPSFPSE